MRPLLAALLLALCVPTAAHASDVDVFTITGNDANHKPYTISFNLQPEDWTPYLGDDFVDVAVNLNGTVASLYIDFNFYDPASPETFSFSGIYPDHFQQYLDIFPSTAGVVPIENFGGRPFPLIFSTGTYTAQNITSCLLPSPPASTDGPPIVTTCDAPATLTVAPLGTPTTPTPEPTSLALLGTGLLATVALRRRRHLVH